MIGNLYENNNYFGKCHLIRRVEDVSKQQMIIFWGGTDINPEFYGQKNHMSDPSDHVRDYFEATVHKAAVEAGIPILGICRGAQFNCVRGGGKLWQHVVGHNKTHDIRLNLGISTDFPLHSVVSATSTHHQMMRPSKDQIIIAEADQNLSKAYVDDTGTHESESPEAEIIFDPDHKALCIQGHPEYLKKDSKFSQLAFTLIKRYLGVNCNV